MANPLDQLYKTKLQLIAVVAVVGGIALMILASWPSVSGWLGTVPFPVPLAELGSTIFATGLLAVFFEYVDRKHGDERTGQRIREAVRKEAPAIRDAVLDSFAFDPAALDGIASNDTLDRIATNALGLRLEDQALAGEVYADLRNQVIRAPERWHDVDVSVSLAPWTGGPSTGRGSMFVATIRWEYRVIPTSATMRFACVSDLDEYRELLRDQTTTSAWHFDPSAAIDASDQAVFELLQLTVGGENRKIRRTQRTGSQIYPPASAIPLPAATRSPWPTPTASWCNATAICSTLTCRGRPRASMSSWTTPAPVSVASTRSTSSPAARTRVSTRHRTRCQQER